MTNSELIREMLGIDGSTTDEALARQICEFRREDCDSCSGAETCRRGHYGLLDWLKEPAEFKPLKGETP